MFVSNLNETKNDCFVSTTPGLYTAEHRKQRFVVRASAPSAKSTLMRNSNLVPRAFPYISIY